MRKDASRDGFCCSNGSDGSYVVSVDDRELIRGGYYQDEISYDIIIGYNSEMSDRDTQWQEAHNSRRKTWHERHEKTYVPLLWSKELAEDASSWAQELLNDCGIPGITHEPGVSEGENLSKNTAITEDGMGQLYPADNVSFTFSSSVYHFFTLFLKFTTFSITDSTTVGRSARNVGLSKEWILDPGVSVAFS